MEYLLLREDLKKYAKDLLDECSNSQEVEELLEDTGGGGQGRWCNFYSADISKKMLSSLAHCQLFRHMSVSQSLGGRKWVAFRAAD